VAAIPVSKEPLRYTDHHVAIRDPAARCKPWPHRLHCRRRAHRAFVQWYAENEERFAVKLELLKRTDTCLEIGFCGFNHIVAATLAHDEISIPVIWDDTDWDVLHWFETYPKRVPHGCVCDQCPEDDRPVFPSRDALWCAEVFP
jgi:hypothetical protein